MREMGVAAGVPLEPESQTQLLDATMNMEGVLLAGVPRACCFDVVFSLILGEASGAVANAWSSTGVLPLLVREDPRGVSLEAGDPRTEEVSHQHLCIVCYHHVRHHLPAHLQERFHLAKRYLQLAAIRVCCVREHSVMVVVAQGKPKRVETYTRMFTRREQEIHLFPTSVE